MGHYVILIRHLDVVTKMKNEVFPNNGILKTHKLYKLFKATRLNLHKSLKSVMQYFADYGEFQCTNGCGNPIPYGTDRIGEGWAACYLGNRKQESPQIYVHLNIHNNSIDVGFSFGFHKNTSKMQKQGKALADYLNNNSRAYHSLKKYGFAAYVGSWDETTKISFDEWLEKIKIDPATCRIVKSFKEDVTEEKLRKTISNIIFFFNGFNYLLTRNNSKSSIKMVKTKDDRIKEYIRLLDIGEKGEKIVYQQEKKKLIQRGINDTYPIWESKKNDNSGYDIVSLDRNGEEIFIEVKTTSKTKEDPLSSTFYMSVNERTAMQAQNERYYIYRVYNVDGDPECEIYREADLNFTPNHYSVSIIVK